MVEKVNAEEVVTKRNGTGTAVVQRVVIMDQHASGVEVTLYAYLSLLSLPLIGTIYAASAGRIYLL
jgi:hypothetical protein